MLEKDYSGLFDFCSGPCGVGDILQIVAVVVLFFVIFGGCFTWVRYRSKRRSHGPFPGGYG